MPKPPPKSKDLPESTIQRKVREAYERAGWMVVKILQTNMNGWPDLQCHKDGITHFIECKTGTKQPGALQKYRHAQLRQQGFVVRVLYTAENLVIDAPTLS